jgi:hypothetical protein
MTSGSEQPVSTLRQCRGYATNCNCCPERRCRNIPVVLEPGSARRRGGHAGTGDARDTAARPVPGSQGFRPVPQARRQQASSAAGFLHRRPCCRRGLAAADSRCQSVQDLLSDARGVGALTAASGRRGERRRRVLNGRRVMRRDWPVSAALPTHKPPSSSEPLWPNADPDLHSRPEPRHPWIRPAVEQEVSPGQVTCLFAALNPQQRGSRRARPAAAAAAPSTSATAPATRW